MDKSEGYFIIWRSLFKDTLWLNGTPTQKLLMVICIGKANHEPGEWHWLGEKFTVERGQFITSLESLKKNMGKHITTQNLRSALNNLEKYHFLTMIATKAGRLITVLNYNDGQSVTNKDTNKEVTKTQQRGNKEVTPNNKDNKDNKDNKKILHKKGININYEKAVEILNYLNEKADKKFTPAGYVGIIIKKLKQFPLVEDYKKVIDIKVAKWKDVPEWDDKLRPETLFTSKFESYKNEKIIKAEKEKTSIERIHEQYKRI
uniref:Putative replication protein n=1 Tax=viral metagenome TaxID=1070528 RepID=A0A6H1ZBZ5_9ZZZZ